MYIQYLNPDSCPRHIFILDRNSYYPSIYWLYFKHCQCFLFVSSVVYPAVSILYFSEFYNAFEKK